MLDRHMSYQVYCNNRMLHTNLVSFTTQLHCYTGIISTVFTLFSKSTNDI